MLDLHEKLERIRRVFDVDRLLNRKTDTAAVAKYYKSNRLAYSIFHNNRGFIHMGLSKDGFFKRKDYLEQAKFVEEYVIKTHAKNVLELAVGRGGSMIYLAEKHPEISFYGIDLPDGQVDFAEKESRRLKNVSIIEGDYHDLTEFSEIDFDIVYVVESLCYSNYKAKVSKEVFDILKSNGLFIVFDGYTSKKDGDLSEDELLASSILTRGMVVDKFQIYEEVVKQITQQGFSLEYEKDCSEYILPTLYRLEKLSKFSLFNISWLGKVVASLFSEDFKYNAASAYLFPDLIKSKIAKYYITVFRRSP